LVFYHFNSEDHFAFVIISMYKVKGSLRCCLYSEEYPSA